jgi:hypothetical protein
MAWCTSEALSDTFMLVKPSSSSACTAFKADSDRASGDGQPYLSNSGRSSEPPLTPTRRGMPARSPPLITSCTFHQAPMLPGVDADAIDDFGRLESQAMVEVNIGNQRHGSSRL